MSDHNAESEWMEIVKTAFWAVLIAMIIRSFLFEPFNIPSSSMKPNLLIGDYLFVSKYEYGYSKFSVPFGRMLPFEGRVWDDTPDRGDVVVFKFPPDESTDYIKRVIGLPGDTVQVRNGRLYLNGDEVPREYIETTTVDEYGIGQEVKKYKQTLPDGETFFIYEEGDNGALDNTKSFTVPDGHYFTMGDNRDNSSDSRANVGFVPHQNLVGEAKVIFFSTNGLAHIWEFWNWPWTVRYERLLNTIE